ncbi:MAG: nucleoside hydrolase [Verrucomicrobia bacterium]|nr:nucleoside hydrolase [Verrucomicrobiota bacterium]
MSLIKQIVTMAGQSMSRANACNDHAELNWWFDPEAAQVVLRASIPDTIIPLDCTNNVPLTADIFNRICGSQRWNDYHAAICPGLRFKDRLQSSYLHLSHEGAWIFD